MIFEVSGDPAKRPSRRSIGAETALGLCGVADGQRRLADALHAAVGRELQEDEISPAVVGGELPTTKVLTSAIFMDGGPCSAGETGRDLNAWRRRVQSRVAGEAAYRGTAIDSGLCVGPAACRGGLVARARHDGGGAVEVDPDA